MVEGILGLLRRVSAESYFQPRILRMSIVRIIPALGNIIRGSPTNIDSSQASNTLVALLPIASWTVRFSFVFQVTQSQKCSPKFESLSDQLHLPPSWHHTLSANRCTVRCCLLNLVTITTSLVGYSWELLSLCFMSTILEYSNNGNCKAFSIFTYNQVPKKIESWGFDLHKRKKLFKQTLFYPLTAELANSFLHQLHDLLPHRVHQAADIQRQILGETAGRKTRSQTEKISQARHGRWMAAHASHELQTVPKKKQLDSVALILRTVQHLDFNLNLLVEFK